MIPREEARASVATAGRSITLHRVPQTAPRSDPRRERRWSSTSPAPESYRNIWTPPALQAASSLLDSGSDCTNISGLSMHPSTRALMTIARRSLVNLSVSGPPLPVSGSSCVGLTCFHQQLRSSNPGGSYLLDLGRRSPASGLRQAATTSGVRVASSKVLLTDFVASPKMSPLLASPERRLRWIKRSHVRQRFNWLV